MLARLAGASTALLGAFEHPDLEGRLQQLDEQQRQIDGLRSQLVEALYPLVSREDAAERRFLLKIKRDAFNGRPVGRRSRHDLWPDADAWTGGTLGELAKVEQTLDRLQSEVGDAIEAALQAEQKALLAFGEDPWFRRGLALASPLVAAARRRYSGRKGRRAVLMQRSLLRYATRTVLKISPYSTLTPLTLARAESAPPRLFDPSPRTATSTVRVKRHLLDPVCRRLLRHPDLLPTLDFGLNPTLEVLAGGRCRLLQSRDTGRGGAGEGAARLVTLGLEGPWFERLVQRLGEGGALPWPGLLECLADPGERPQDQGELARHLLDVGLLELRPPWPGYTPRLEQELLDLLEGRGEIPDVAPVAAALRELLDAETAFHEASSPEEAVVALIRRVDGLHAAVARLTRTEDMPFPATDSRAVYEDVVISAEGGEPMLRVPLQPLRDARSAVEPLWRASALFSPTHEVRIALGEMLRRHHGEACEVPLMRVFAETQQLWKAASLRLRGDGGIFDPFGLPAVRELKALRSRVRKKLEAAVHGAVDPLAAHTLSATALSAALDEIPEHLRSPVPPALCVQPIDVRAERWVANDIFPAVGRLSSRFSSVLPEAQKEAYLGQALSATSVDIGGEGHELLDLLFTKGNTVNVHWPQTRSVFMGPGEVVDLPPERVRRPGDLLVQRRPCGELRLTDRAGQLFLPVFLSPMADIYLPQLWQFLLLFGVPAAALQSPGRSISAAPGLEISPRLSVGNLVIRRCRWTFSGNALSELGGGALEDFSNLDRWRRGHGLPRKVYVKERVAGDTHQTRRFKPQFIDFGSPSLVALLKEATGDGEIELSEALPDPESFPLDPGMNAPRTFEVVVDGPLS